MVKRRESFPVKPRGRVKMEVIPEPKPGTASMPVGDPAKPPFAYMKGGASTDYTCGICGFALLESIDPGQVQHLVFKCMACDAFNRVTAGDVMWPIPLGLDPRLRAAPRVVGAAMRGGRCRQRRREPSRISRPPSS
jgi:hypothetical protein